jgi:hypothetical protein
MSFVQALFEQERQAVITWREADSARRRAEKEEKEARCQPDNIAIMAALSAVYRCRTAVDQAAVAYCKARDYLDSTWDVYSRLLSPWPICTGADACCDLSNADATDLVDVLFAGRVVTDPHGWNRLGWIDSRKLVVWFLRRAQFIAIIEGHDE